LIDAASKIIALISDPGTLAAVVGIGIVLYVAKILCDRVIDHLFDAVSVVAVRQIWPRIEAFALFVHAIGGTLSAVVAWHMMKVPAPILERATSREHSYLTIVHFSLGLAAVTLLGCARCTSYYMYFRALATSMVLGIAVAWVHGAIALVWNPSGFAAPEFPAVVPWLCCWVVVVATYYGLVLHLTIQLLRTLWRVTAFLQ